MECLGGNGYVEEAPLARMYREAPLNGIWEGSANVICLDVLRAIERSPDSLRAFVKEMAPESGDWIERRLLDVKKALTDPVAAEGQARAIVEALARCMQASLMRHHSGRGGR